MNTQQQHVSLNQPRGNGRPVRLEQALSTNGSATHRHDACAPWSAIPSGLLGLIRKLALWLASWRYDVKTLGLKNIPSTGGVLLVCNHVSYVDTVILSLACPRAIRFLSFEGLFQVPLLGAILRLAGAIPVSPTRATDAIRRASDCVRQGEIVCIFPEGQLTRTGCLMELKSGFELIARHAGCPVVVAHLDGLWGSIYSFAGGRYFTKWPTGFRRQATVSFSTSLQAVEASTGRVREQILDLGAKAFQARLAHHSLTLRLLQALKSKALKPVIMDPSSPIKKLRGIELLTVAWTLAKRWKKLPGRRVGILLPPGIAGTLANAGLLFAGKIPVNLNPTLTLEATASCLNLADIQTVITAGIVRTKFPDFPWPDDVILIERELKDVSPFTRALSGFACLFLPVRVLAQGLRQMVGDEEALLLFTSGTSGLPKGVALTHRQVLSNFDQVAETGFLETGDRILSALPLFHSFGLTMGLFMPMLAGQKLVTAPSPLDCSAVAKAASEGQATVLLSTPTFLRNYAKRIPKEAFSSLRLAATGAERLPAETAGLFRSRFGCEVFEGYGLTEASPVVSFNMSNPPRGLGAQSDHCGAAVGSSGRLLPGMTMRLLDPETGIEAPDRCCGILALRGPNIINHYLNDESPEKFQNGWLITGDIVRVNNEGFLFLEGRLSRFSKIGGEMVSHAAVEEALVRAFPDPASSAQDCVLGRPSSEKGEELVLLTTRKITREDLRRKLDVPNLWIPRHVICIESMPTLATGKLDLAACRHLIEDHHVTV